MKVILKGVALKQYLSVQTLVAKIVGLLFALGCVYYTGLRRVSPFLYSGSIRLSLSLSLSLSLDTNYMRGNNCDSRVTFIIYGYIIVLGRVCRLGRRGRSCT